MAGDVVRCRTARFASNCWLPAGGRRRDRRALHRVEAVHLVGRRLYRHLVVHSVGRIEPLIGRNLAAGGKRDQQTAGDVSLRQSRLIGADAVDVDLHGRIVRGLADEDIHRARQSRDRGAQSLRRSDSSRPRRYR